MTNEAKISAYKEAYAEAGKYASIHNTGYPEKRTNYDFYFDIGKAHIEFSLKARTDMFQLSATIPTDGASDDELSRKSEDIKNTTDFTSVYYDDKFIIRYSLPLVDLSDAEAEKAVIAAEKKFINYLIENYADPEEKAADLEGASRSETAYKSETAEIGEAETPAKKNNKNDRRKNAGAFDLFVHDNKLNTLMRHGRLTAEWSKEEKPVYIIRDGDKNTVMLCVKTESPVSRAAYELGSRYDVLTMDGETIIVKKNVAGNEIANMARKISEDTMAMEKKPEEADENTSADVFAFSSYDYFHDEDDENDNTEGKDKLNDGNQSEKEESEDGETDESEKERMPESDDQNIENPDASSADHKSLQKPEEGPDKSEHGKRGKWKNRERRREDGRGHLPMDSKTPSKNKKTDISDEVHKMYEETIAIIKDRSRETDRSEDSIRAREDRVTKREDLVRQDKKENERNAALLADKEKQIEKENALLDQKWDEYHEKEKELISYSESLDERRKKLDHDESALAENRRLLETDVRRFGDEKSAVDAKREELNKLSEALETRQQTLDKRELEIDASESDAAKKHASIEKDIEKMNSERKILETRKFAIEERARFVSMQEKEKNIISPDKLRAARSEAEKAKADAADAKKKLQELQSRIAGAEAALSESKKETAAAKAETVQVQKKMAARKQDFSNLKERYNSLVTDYKRLQEAGKPDSASEEKLKETLEKLDKANSELSSLRGQVYEMRVASEYGQKVHISPDDIKEAYSEMNFEGDEILTGEADDVSVVVNTEKHTVKASKKFGRFSKMNAKKLTQLNESGEELTYVLVDGGIEVRGFYFDSIDSIGDCVHALDNI